MSEVAADGGTTTPPVGMTSQTVYERLVREILAGERRAGETLHDRELALELGISRTPVREAIQLLRQLGIVETSANRYTRIVRLGPQDVERCARIFVELYREAAVELIRADRVPMAAMEQHYLAAVEAARTGALAEFWPCVFAIHDELLHRCRNPHLVRTLRGVAVVLRVAVVTNAAMLDPAEVLRANRTILDSIATRDPQLGRRGAAMFLRIGAELAAG